MNYKIYIISQKIAKYDFLKKVKKEINDFNLQNVDTNNKLFKKIFKKIYKQILDHNTPAQYMTVEEVSKLPHIDDIDPKKVSA